MRFIVFVTTILILTAPFSMQLTLDAAETQLLVQHWNVSGQTPCGTVIGSPACNALKQNLSYEISEGNEHGLFVIHPRTGDVSLAEDTSHFDLSKDSLLTIKETQHRSLSDDSISNVFLRHAFSQGISAEDLKLVSVREYFIQVKFTPLEQAPSHEGVIMLADQASSDVSSLDADEEPVLVELFVDAQIPVIEDQLTAEAALKPPLLLAGETLPQETLTSENVDEEETSTADSSVLIASAEPELEKSDKEQATNHTSLVWLNLYLAGAAMSLTAGYLLILMFIKKYLRKKSSTEESLEEDSDQQDSQQAIERKFMAFKTNEDVQNLRKHLLSGNHNDDQEIQSENEKFRSDLHNLSGSGSASGDGLQVAEAVDVAVEEYEADSVKTHLQKQTAEFRVIANTAAKSAVNTYWLSRLRGMSLSVIGLCAIGSAALILFVRDLQNLLLCSAWSTLLLVSLLIAAQKLKRYITN